MSISVACCWAGIPIGIIFIVVGAIMFRDQKMDYVAKAQSREWNSQDISEFRRNDKRARNAAVFILVGIIGIIIMILIMSFPDTAIP